jgi:hypothetical protein
MSATDTLEAVAELLPPERKLRFLAMAARFRSVPEDDEYLQILEAIGFMTLLWKEVPEDIRRIVAGASPAAGNIEDIAGILRATVRESIPTYEDLRQIVQRLESHEQLLIRAGRVSIPAGDRSTSGWRWALFTGLGAVLTLVVLEFLSHLPV